MSRDKSMEGTGSELGTIPLSEKWEIVFTDDGDHDSYTRSVFRNRQNGSTANVDSGISHMRQDIGDDAVVERLGDIRDAIEGADDDSSDDAPTASTTYGVGHFVCDGCHRTWVQRKNQTPDASVDTCPDCEGSA